MSSRANLQGQARNLRRSIVAACGQYKAHSDCFMAENKTNALTSQTHSDCDGGTF